MLFLSCHLILEFIEVLTIAHVVSAKLWASTKTPKNMSTASRTELLKSLISRYDNRIPPYFATDTHDPTVVWIQLNIYGIDTFNEAEMDYSVALFLQQQWMDKRLKWDHAFHQEPLELDSTFMDRLWVPDLFFSNEKEANFHRITVPNKMMHLFKNGTVLYSIRLSLTLSCSMTLHNYPFDWQSCGIIMESYGHSTKTIIFRWFPDLPLDMNRDMALPQFHLMGSELSDCTKLYGGTTNYTCLSVDFHLKRKAGYFLIQLYVPSIMVVILSWVSFWLNIDAVAARISLGILTILAMTTQSSGESKASPKVSYIRALDVWMFTCMVFVFSSLLEFALLNVWARRIRKSSTERSSLDDNSDIHLIENPQNRKRESRPSVPVRGYSVSHNAIPDPPPGINSEYFDFHETALSIRPKPDLENGLLPNTRPRDKRSISRSWRVSRVKKLAVKKASIFDRVSRILFPTTFIIFNIVYWTTYMISFQNHKKAGVWPSKTA